MKNILFVHNAFPSQFEQIGLALKEQGHHITFFFTAFYEFGQERTSFYNLTNEVHLLQYGPNNPHIEYHARENIQFFEKQYVKGRDVFRVLKEYYEENPKPDLIYTACSFGDGILLKDLFPDVPLIGFAEYYYDMHKLYDCENGEKYKELTAFSKDEEFYIKNRMMNLGLLSTMSTCDALFSPTHFQKNLFPRAFVDQIRILYDGIDTQKLHDHIIKHKIKPCVTPNGTVLYPGANIVTYGSPSLENVRGFPQAMEAFGLLLEQCADVNVVIWGNEGARYSTPNQDHHFTKQQALERFVREKHHNRLHFVGPLCYTDFLNMLRLSKAHLYLTAPFVLSRSCLEAMSLGCAVVGADIAPVREVISHEKNGLLAPFFEPEKIAIAIKRALTDDALNQRLRENAKRTIEQTYSVNALMPKHLALANRFLFKESQIPLKEHKKRNKGGC